MNYYNEIKNQLINNEINKKVKKYSINKSDLYTYYSVGKILSEAGKHYGEGIIKEYSQKLKSDLNKNYSVRLLYKMLKYYNFVFEEKLPTLSAKLSWSHYDEILKFDDVNKIIFYIKMSEQQNLSVRQLREKIKSNEYERLPESTKNKYEIQKYYNVGKLLLEAGNNYGDGIIKEYSKKLTNEIGKKYSVRYLFDIRKLYLFVKVHPVGAQLTMSHYRLLFPLNDDNEIDYYINQIIKRNLSKRELEVIIKSNEYGRLPEHAKNKLIKKEKSSVVDFVKNPIRIKTNTNKEIVSEKILQKIILEDIENFLEELGLGFTFIKSEYKIKIDDRYNYIDLLLYNIKYKCYVVVELKVTELKKEHTGQIMTYMNYIDKNIKTIEENDTVGIIICRQDNEYVIKYCSDDRIIARVYELV